MVEVSQLIGTEGRADVDGHRASRAARARPAPSTPVFDPKQTRPDRHSRPVVRQVVGRASRDDSGEAGRVERQEPDTGRTVGRTNVGTDIGLGKPREPGNLVTRRRSDDHLEGHETDPRRSVEGLDFEAGRQQPLHLGGRVPPVEKREVAPLVQHHRLGYFERAGAGPAAARFGREEIWRSRGHPLIIHTYELEVTSQTIALVKVTSNRLHHTDTASTESGPRSAGSS